MFALQLDWSDTDVFVTGIFYVGMKNARAG